MQGHGTYKGMGRHLHIQSCIGNHYTEHWRNFNEYKLEWLKYFQIIYQWKK